MSTSFLPFIAFFAFITSFPPAGTANAEVNKKGSCVFASKYPEIGKEADYKKMGIEIKTHFKYAEPIFGRCYFPMPQGNYFKKSKTDNAMRKQYFSVSYPYDRDKWELIRDSWLPFIRTSQSEQWEQTGVAAAEKQDLTHDPAYEHIKQTLQSNEDFKKTTYKDKYMLRGCIVQTVFYDNVEKWVQEGNELRHVWEQAQEDIASGCFMIDASELKP